MKKIIWTGAWDAVCYGLILWGVWLHAHWSVAGLLTIFCVRAVLSDVIAAMKKLADVEHETQLDKILITIKSTTTERTP